MELQIHLDGTWHSCASLSLIDPERAGRRNAVRLQYEAEYAIEHFGAQDHRALSVRLPVNLATQTPRQWPAFLIDLLPQGAARKRLERLSEHSMSEWGLLERGAVNPVGNLRVCPTEPPELRPPSDHPGFDLEEMTGRGDEFVDFAHEMGATVAGATDTQGEAPKFWVIEDANGRWHPDDGSPRAGTRRHMLLKFPVPESGPRAADILRNEVAYQRVAQRLGLRVAPALPEFVKGALLITRFDRRRAAGKDVRLGVESLYSVADILDSAQTPLRHHEVLIALSRCLTGFESQMLEYIRRDLLNLAVGNRDNHGRNTAVLKELDGTIRLSPLYDFGPAFLDARSIVRVIRWEGEEPGGTHWNRVLECLQTRFEEVGVEQPDWREVAREMRAFGRELRSLPALMRDCGVDQAIIDLRHHEISRLIHELTAIETP